MKVSVLTVTYNQEEYIAQALESALCQQTKFAYEIVVAEDCSSDATRAEVRRVAAKHPDKLRPLLNEHNLGMHRNFLQAYAACRGEYVALLEGDDYWTSPHKLQRQVDFLDQHSECALCFHNAIMICEGSEEQHLCRAPERKETFGLLDLLPANFIYGCTVLFRNKLIGQLPDWVFQVLIGDWALYLLLACHGKLGYIDETMAVYRRLRTGQMSKATSEQVRRSTQALYEHVNRHLNYEYSTLIQALAAMAENFSLLEDHAHRLEEQVHDLLQQARQVEERTPIKETRAIRVEREVRPLPEPTAGCLPPAALRARILPHRASLIVSPGSAVTIPVSVKNMSNAIWTLPSAAASQRPTMLGNHWTDAMGNLLVADDARAELPNGLRPGEEIDLSLTVRSPAEAGSYFLEFDLVHEIVGWFKDKGSESARIPVQVESASRVTATDLADLRPDGCSADSADFTPRIEMYATPKQEVIALIAQAGGEVVDVVECLDEDWISVTYFAQKR
jgi:hypothetical protein